MKLKSLTLLFLLIPLSLWAGNPQELARMNVGIVGSGAAAGGITCSSPNMYASFDQGTDAEYVSANDSYAYAGTGLYDPGATRNFCGFDVYIYNVSGNVSGYTYTFGLWNMLGNNLTGSYLASCTVPGTSMAGDTWVGCRFTNYYTIYSGTNYALTIKSSVIDDPNYVRITYGVGGLSGNDMTWLPDLTVFMNTSGDDRLKLYEAQ